MVRPFLKSAGPMFSRTRVLLRLGALGACALAACGNQSEEVTVGPVASHIVSVAPSITETLFALGCGAKVAGVSSYCSYPTAVSRLPRLGGYIDPNFEMLLALQPDLAVILKEHSNVKKFCEKNGIRVVTVDNHNVDAILGSIKQIGDACGAPKAADSLMAAIRADLRQSPPQRPRPRMLFCIDRAEPGSGRISRVFVAGHGTFYTDLMMASGAVNAYPDSDNLYPTLGVEGIVDVDPDVIVDITINQHVTPEQLMRDWKSISIVRAVANGHVFCITEPYMTVPGPRIALILRELRAVVGTYRKSVPGNGTGGESDL